MSLKRYRVKVTGIVQGVGFRPFVYALARALFLNGNVRNTGDGVMIEAEGRREDLDAFVERIKTEAPPLSLIREITFDRLEAYGYTDFEIIASSAGSRNTMISPDISVCADCGRELFDSSDRRYRYPFINCTNCGPRFTIIRDVPYDRPNTTMNGFGLCEACRRQYEDPSDRRYHAQPVSCAVCGPELILLDREGNRVESGDPAGLAARLLARGGILAVKGLGGYHLACDASRADAVAELRRRKHRDEKPFALMARDLETVRSCCEVNAAEEKLLLSSRRPVVLLKRRTGCPLPEEIAPGSGYLGVMLPYTPVHLLLFADGGAGKPGGAGESDESAAEACPPWLVMTSGNKSSEPICYTDESALRELKGIADGFLANNREIYIRTDDSVTRVFRGREYILRRSRGYVPAPVAVDRAILPAKTPQVLACGGELKNTFCLSRGNEFYLSHHIGDLENIETMRSFEEGVGHFRKLFDIEPVVIACDMHPGYLSTQYALSLPEGVKIPVQHHHAHIAACMAENGLTGDVIGVAFDGTGYGVDGRIWGGEFFTGSYGGFKRAGRLRYVGMPGGDAAVREPWRMAASYLHSAGFDITDISDPVVSGLLPGLPEDRLRLKLQALEHMMESGFNSPQTSSMGRLFEAVSALAGVRNINGYEAQAAMELESAAQAAAGAGGRGAWGEKIYDYGISAADGMYIADMTGVITGIAADRRAGMPPGAISCRFHETAAMLVLDMCRRLRTGTGLSRVCLSGGVFQNLLLLARCAELLEGEGFEVFVHSLVPSNDGGISLGQAVIAMAQCDNFC